MVSDSVEHRRVPQFLRHQRDFASALAHYDQAAALYRAAGDPVLLAHTIRHAGDILHHSSQFASAETRFLEALDLYRLHPEAPPLDLASALRSLAVLKSDHASPPFEEARPLWEKARAIYTALAIPASIAECEARLAQLAQEGPRSTASPSKE